MTGPVLVLVGPPGAGKTTVGERAAQRLGVGFRDTDLDVEQTTGRRIADIFVEDGEQAFRAHEFDAVSAALARPHEVLALGGGAILNPLTRELLVPVPVVFLTVGITDAARRIGFNRDRPLLLKSPRAQWIALMEQRRPLYEDVANGIVDTDGRSVDEVVERVLRSIGPGVA